MARRAPRLIGDAMADILKNDLKNDLKQIAPVPIKALYDAAFLAQLHAAAFTDGAWSKAAFADMLAQNTVTAFGHADGFILLQRLPDGVEILTLAVHPDKRRRQLARRLMTHMITALQPPKIWLEVAADNAAARGLYEALGFVEYGRRTKYYKRAGNLAVDAVLMRLDMQEGATDEQKNGT